jgi:hypothetical protein
MPLLSPSSQPPDGLCLHGHLYRRPQLLEPKYGHETEK